MDRVYNQPRYYEIAFSYRDIPKETTVLEQAAALFSHIPVRSVLEFACGNSPHMVELLQRGYRYTGIDINPEMLAYSQKKAANAGFAVDLIQANLVDIRLPAPVDLAYTMLGSLYVRTTAELKAHFLSAAHNLRPGGLYFLDWCVDFSPLNDSVDHWRTRRGSTRVSVRYSTAHLNSVEQTFTETLHLTIHEDDDVFEIQDSTVRRAIYPQEFRILIDSLDDFEFVGWYNNWNLRQPLTGDENPIARPITIIRRV